jgi:hypothetical protein
MEWLIFGTLVTYWSLRVVQGMQATGLLKRSQRASETPQRAILRGNLERRLDRERRDAGWLRDYAGHMGMGETSLNTFSREQLREAVQILERAGVGRKKDLVSEKVDWKREGF